MATPRRGCLMLAFSSKLKCIPQYGKYSTPFLIQKRDITDFERSYTMAQMKRGTGGRSSFSGDVVTVFGATSGLGRIIVNQLGKIGAQVIIPYRCDPYFVRDLKLAGDLGQILYSPFHLKDEESIKKSMLYSTHVVNCIGAFQDTKNFTIEDVEIDGARLIARGAKESGVKRLIHISALGASENPKPHFLKQGSRIHKAKYQGELAVREEFPDATIMRPSFMFGGYHDKFFHHFANPRRIFFDTIPLWKRGEQTIKQPVKTSNVAQGVIVALHHPDAPGCTYQCIGPTRHRLSDIVDYFLYIINRNGTWRVPTNFNIFMYPAMLAYKWTGVAEVIFDVEMLEREATTDIVDDEISTLSDLGVLLESFHETAHFELRMFRRMTYSRETPINVPYARDPPPPAL